MPGTAPSPPAPPRQRGPARDVDNLIRELQRINLSQCMDQLNADIDQLNTIEQQLPSGWSGLYVRCPDPDPGGSGADMVDKKSSSGYSTGSGSPPGSSDVSSEVAGVTGPEGVRMTSDESEKVTNDAAGAGVSFFDAKYASVNKRPVNFTPSNGFLRQHSFGLSRSSSTDSCANGHVRALARDKSSPFVRREPSPAPSLPAEERRAARDSVSPPVNHSQWRARALAKLQRPLTGSGVVGGKPKLLPKPTEGTSKEPPTTDGASARLGGLIQASVAHSSEQRGVTALTPRSGFCPPAASTPTLPPRQPRSPKTLRFASSHELIPPDSPSRRQVSAGVPPRPGILRSRTGGTTSAGKEGASLTNSTHANKSGGLQRPATPGWLARSPNGTLTSSAATPSGTSSRTTRTSSDRRNLDDLDSAERFSRVVSALSRLENELSSAQQQAASGRAYGTPQFVRRPPRRQLSFSHLPPPSAAASDPLVLVTTTTDSEKSDSDDDWFDGLDEATLARAADGALGDEGDFVLSPSTRRGAKIPVGYAAGATKPRRGSFSSWLLSCGSRRRPPSPPSAYLGPPPADDTPAPDTTMYECNVCKCKFAEHTMLVSHVRDRHIRVQMKPKYGCGLCPARFYASKFLARHCAYQHNSMGDKRTPQCLRAER